MCGAAASGGGTGRPAQLKKLGTRVPCPGGGCPQAVSDRLRWGGSAWVMSPSGACTSLRQQGVSDAVLTSTCAYQRPEVLCFHRPSPALLPRLWLLSAVTGSSRCSCCALTWRRPRPKSRPRSARSCSSCGSCQTSARRWEWATPLGQQGQPRTGHHNMCRVLSAGAEHELLYLLKPQLQYATLAVRTS